MSRRESDQSGRSPLLTIALIERTLKLSSDLLKLASLASCLTRSQLSSGVRQHPTIMNESRCSRADCSRPALPFSEPPTCISHVADAEAWYEALPRGVPQRPE